MLELAEILSQNFIHVRVDFYSINTKIYFGEITFYSEGGFGKFNPPKFEQTVCDWIKLPYIFE